MDQNQLIQEINYKAVRSSGAGGQNVNKVSSKVELHFSIPSSCALSDTEKARALKKLSSRLTKTEKLILQCDESRSQHRNKEIVTRRFVELLKDALKKAKPRKKTKPSRAAKLKRLRAKKIRSDKKAGRKNPLNN